MGRGVGERDFLGYQGSMNGKERKQMKCDKCDYEGPMKTFRRLFGAKASSNEGCWECPKCRGWQIIDELEEERKEKAQKEAG